MSIFTLQDIPEQEFLYGGHAGCWGCGEAIAQRLALKVLGRNMIFVGGPSCITVIAGVPMPSVTMPLMITVFAAGGAALSGIDAALKAKGKDGQVIPVGFFGDGGTVDIGLQALSAAVERRHDFIYLCLDNEVYMNTGGQRSGATPFGARTTTTPLGKLEPKKDVAALMIDHGAPYVATASISHPADYVGKVKKAKEIKGSRYLHVLTPCPDGWGVPSSKTVEIAKLAVETRIFPLYEFKDGHLRITHKPRKFVPVGDYIKRQKRFQHLSEREISEIQSQVDSKWNDLLSKEAAAKTS